MKKKKKKHLKQQESLCADSKSSPETFIPEELTVWTLNAITQLLLQKRFTDSSLFLLSTISASGRVVRHIVHGWVTLVFYVGRVEEEAGR